MSTQPAAPRPSRTPWIIAGVLGCLVLCLLVAVVGGSAYFILSPARVVVLPTVPQVMTVPIAVLPTVPSQPTQAPQNLPTVPPPPPQSTATVAQATAVPVQATVTVPQPTATRVPPTATRPPAAPKGRIAFTVRRGDRPEDNFIWIMNADGSGAKEILKRSSEPSFSPDGNKIAYYQWSDGIFVANADGTNPIKVLGDGVTGYIAWSHDGRWIALSARPARTGNIFVDAVPPDGSAVKDNSMRRNIVVGESPDWSPDDTQVVFHTCRDSACGIYKVGSGGGGTAIPIVTDDGGLPAWSPDGKTVLYQKDADGAKQLFVINADGSGKKQLTTGAAMHVSANWSADGNFIFYRTPEDGQWGIWRMNADGTGKIKIAGDMPPGDWAYDRIAVTK
ncbi:MAG: PD40 domain-containing protein [Chloroflexi bacterium]|nr:PD40 domain-containing protein [Chloroflexota bacterium]